MTSSADQIERDVFLEAPIERVWRAIANAEEFGTWFGVNLEGERFEPGKTAHGNITNPGYEHLVWQVTVTQMIPPTTFAFTWHPHAIDPAVDYSTEHPTLVEFTLAREHGGTRLVVVESGFDKVPEWRRELALRMNGNGWTQQMVRIAKYLKRDNVEG